MPEVEDGLARAVYILHAHLKVIVAEPLCFMTQLYIAQLKLYDEYFFSQDRYTCTGRWPKPC